MSGKLDAKLTKKAAEALLDFTRKKRAAAEKKQLVESADPVSVMIALKRIPDKQRQKPILIPLDYPLFSDEETKVCLFVKDPQSKVRDMVEAQGITGIDKVMGVSNLRDKFKQFEQKRQLSNSFDLFLCDEAVWPLLPRLLGKPFYQKKKQPVPVNFKSGEKLAKVLQEARDSTCFYSGWGSSVAIKVGRTDFKASELAANIGKVVESMAKSIPHGWKNVQSVHIKTHDSVALPIYHANPKELIEVAPPEPKVSKQKLAKREAARVAREAREAEEAAAAQKAKKPAKSSPKKRAKEAPEPEAAPSKKAKTAAKAAPKKAVAKKASPKAAPKASPKASPKAAPAKRETRAKKKK